VKVCPDCGAQIAENAKFCTGCGMKLAVPEAAQQIGYESVSPKSGKQQKKKSAGQTAIIVTVVGIWLFLVLLAVGAAAILLSGAVRLFTGNDRISEPVTYKAVSCISHGQILDEELMDLIGGCYVRFNGDGTGMFYCFGDLLPMTYDNETLEIEGESMSYSVRRDEMEFEYADGSVFTLEVTQEDPDTVLVPELDWDTGEMEEQDMSSALPAQMHWIGQPIAGLDLDGATLSFSQNNYSGTAWLAENVDGELVVERIHLFLNDCTYSDVREMLIDQYGEPTDEGEEPYVASNGGAVTYCWFEHPVGTLRLTSGSEEDFLKITMTMAHG